MTSAPDTPPAVIATAYRAVVALYSALLATFVLYAFWQIPGGNLTAIVVLLSIKSLPLLIFVRGLRARSLRTSAPLKLKTHHTKILDKQTEKA